jgi:glycosyltransferase involved in cell wall biosynthesis
MKLSVVVVVYNMPREASNTLSSLSAAYQRDICVDDYEVIVVENGSTKRLDPSQVTRLGNNFRYHYLQDASASPAAAINFGIRQAQGEVIGVMIDGARICSPGLLHFALIGIGVYKRAVVATLGFYLGDGFQRFSIMHGYDHKEEERLLERISWPQDGYRLFEVSSLDESSHWTARAPLCESNALFMRKELWAELGGIDEQFDMPGGGLVNLDTFIRACELPDIQLVVLLGEGTFHQVHGGVATNAPPEVHEQNNEHWRTQYRKLRGKDITPPNNPRTYIGSLPESCLNHLINDEVG